MPECAPLLLKEVVQYLSMSFEAAGLTTESMQQDQLLRGVVGILWLLTAFSTAFIGCGLEKQHTMGLGEYY